MNQPVYWKVGVFFRGCVLLPFGTAASTQDMPCVGPHKGRERQMFFGGTKVLAFQIMAGQPTPPLTYSPPKIWPY